MGLSIIGRSVDCGYNFFAHGGDNGFVNNKALSFVVAWLKWSQKIEDKRAEAMESTLGAIKTFGDLRKGVIAANDLIQMASMGQVPGGFDSVKLVGNLASGMKASDKLKLGIPWDEVSLGVLGVISGGAGMIVAANKIGLVTIFGIASDIYTGRGQLDAKKVEVIFTTALNVCIFIFKTGEFATSFFKLMIFIPQVGERAHRGKDQVEAYFSRRVREWIATGMTISDFALSVKKEFYEK